MRSARWLAALLVGGVVLASTGDTAWAHAELVSSDPVAGSVLDAPPDVVTLQFSEGVESSLGGIRLFDGRGEAIDVGATYHPDGQGSLLQVDLPALADGSYVVDWRVVSADSHPIQGAFTFQVGPESDLEPGIFDQILGRDRTGHPAGIALAVSRGVVTAAIAVVFGGLAMLGFGVVATTRANRTLVLVASAVGFAAGLLQLPLEVGYATGKSLGVVFDGDAWSAAIDTRIGLAWLIRALVIGSSGLLLTLTLRRSSDAWWRFAFGLSLAAVGLASAFSGHGATGRWEFVGIVATVVHVAAMALWLGGIVVVLLAIREIDGDHVRAFSRVALVAMMGVVGSGAVQGIRQVGSIDGLTSTAYGKLLLAKLALVAVVLALAALSRRSAQRDEPDRRALTRTVGLEVVIGVAIVAITSLLMAANPSQAESSQPYSVNLVDGDYLVNITVDPARVGHNEMHIYLSNAESSLLEPDEVTVELTDPSRDVAPIGVSVVRIGASHYTAPDVVIPYAASWQLTVSARYNEFDEVTFTTTVPIR